jgi:hypothetical protein
MLPGDIIAKTKHLVAEKSFLKAIVDGARQHRRAARRSHRIGPGRRTVFTYARWIAKRNASKYPLPHQSTRERTRGQRRILREVMG